MDDLYRIVTSLTEPKCNLIARKTVRSLQKMTEEIHSGEDSGLKTLWDKVCVQVQCDASQMWDYYVEIIKDLIEQQAGLLNSEV